MSSLSFLPRSSLVRQCRQLWHRFGREPCESWSRHIEKWCYRSLWDKQLAGEAANFTIASLLLDKKPCLVSRIGNTEGRIIGEYFFRRARYSRLTRKQAHQNAGIFPVQPQLLSAFSDIYAGSIEHVDLLGFWQTSYQARLLAERYPQISLAPLPSLEPYLHPSPWSAALKYRRVLIVHPFARSMMSQYQLNRSMIFATPDVLPEMDLQAFLPPQTLAPLTAGYSSWCEALAHLIEDVLSLNFDVALLGCGAYGLPLGAAIKKSGRQAIHLGGALQILFGIRGRRWDQIPEIQSLMNDYWIRPSSRETPEHAKLVEEGCYW